MPFARPLMFFIIFGGRFTAIRNGDMDGRAAQRLATSAFGFSSWRMKTVNFRTAIFRQINKDQPRMHHDALGTSVLLTDLLEGQEATVLQLPAQPKTPAEEAAQRRVTYVG